MASMHTRNVEGMVRHRRNVHLDAIRRTEASLNVLQESGAVITFRLIAKHAGVFRSWLYKQQVLRDRIAVLRRDYPWPTHRSAERTSGASKEAIIRTLRERVAEERTAKAKLTDENKELRKVNEVLAGQVHYCRTFHTTNAALVSDYSRIVYHAPPTFGPDKSELEPQRAREFDDELPVHIVGGTQ